MRELISIIIPIYNSASFLNKCLESVIAQTYTNIEIVLINDGSVDQSREICEEYCKKDSRIKLINTVNQGVSSARNTGIYNSSGTYLIFVDSDDFVEKTMVEKLYNAQIATKADLIVSALSSTTNHASFSIDVSSGTLNEIIFLFKNYLLFGPMEKLFKTEIVKNERITFPVDFNYGEDLLFNIKYLYKVHRITYINDILYHYETVNNSESLSHRKRWNMYDNDMCINNSIKSWFLDNDLVNEEVQKYISDRYFDTVYNSICLPFEKASPWKDHELYKYYDYILGQPSTKWSLKQADLKKYPKWLVYLIRHNCSGFLVLIALLKRRLG